MSSIFDISESPSCSEEKVFVQVLGVNHPEGHGLFLKGDGGSSIKADEYKKVYASDYGSKLNGNFCSMVYSWGVKSNQDYELWMEIKKANSSDTIKLLVEEKVVVERERSIVNSGYGVQIIPVIPLTMLQGVKVTNGGERVVGIRSGYIYIYRKGKLWREIKVVNTENELLFYDIDVGGYRGSAGEITESVRVSVGVALQEVWIPYVSYMITGHYYVMYSEVQLSAERINFLEQNESIIIDRCSYFRELVEFSYEGETEAGITAENISNLIPKEYLGVDKELGKSKVDELHHIVTNTAIPLYKVGGYYVKQSIRSRSPADEWQFDNPHDFLMEGDLNKYISDAKFKADDFLQKTASGNAAINPAIETRAWLSNILAAINDSESGKEFSVWQNEAAEYGEVSNILKDASGRCIYGLVLDDPIYRIRQLYFLINAYFKLIRAYGVFAGKKKENLKSSMFIQNLIYLKQEQVTAAINEVDVAIMHKLFSESCALERASIWEHFNFAQFALCEALKEYKTINAIADHLSLNGFEYIAEYRFFIHVISLLGMEIDEVDGLSLGGTILLPNGFKMLEKDGSAAKYLHEICDTKDNSLHKMLWPPEQELSSPYKVKDIKNDGSGLFRAGLFYSWDDEDAPTEDQDNFNAGLLAGIYWDKRDSIKREEVSALFYSFSTGVGSILIDDVLDLMFSLERVDWKMHLAQRNIEHKDEFIKKLERMMRYEKNSIDNMKANVAGLYMHDKELERLAKKISKKKEVPYKSIDKLLDVVYPFLRAVAPKKLGASCVNKLDKDYYNIAIGDDFNKFIKRKGGRKIFSLYLDNLSEDIRKEIKGLDEDIKDAVKAQKERKKDVKRYKSSLQEDYKELDRLYTEKEISISKGRSLGLPFFMTVIGFWNVANMLAPETDSELGAIYEVTGAVSAVVDAAYYLDELMARYSIHLRYHKAISQGSPRLSGTAISNFSISGVKPIASLGRLSAGLGFLMSCMDFYEARSVADNARYGYFITMVSNLAGLALVFLGVPVLNVVGIAIVIISLIGTVVAIVFKSNDFAIWLKNGPFSNDRVKSPLDNPETALYRLVGILVDLQAILREKNNQNKRRKRTIIEVIVDTNLPAVLSDAYKINIKQSVRGIGLVGSRSFPSPDLEAGMPELVNFDMAKGQYTYETNIAKSRMSDMNVRLEYHLMVSVQAEIRLPLGADGGFVTWYFPSPKPLDKKSILVSNLENEKDNAIFWHEYRLRIETEN